MLQHEEVLLLYDKKKSQKRDLIFASSPARVCQGDYEDETFFDKPSFVQVVTYVVVTSRVLQPCPVQGYEGVHHLHHLHLCPDVQECEGDEQVAKRQMTSPMNCKLVLYICKYFCNILFSQAKLLKI